MGLSPLHQGSWNIVIQITILLLTSSPKTHAWPKQQTLRCSADSADCVCELRSAIDDMTNAITFSRKTGFELTEEIQQFNCKKFKRLPSSLLIEAAATSTFVNRILYEVRNRRVRRQIPIGTPTNEVFENAISHVLPGDPIQYVILGQSASFSCTGDPFAEEAFFVPKKFTWTHYDGTPITAALSSVDHKSGVLSFKSAQLTDVDIYNCTVESQAEGGGMTIDHYSHELLVVYEPIFWLKLQGSYQTKECMKQEVDLISENIGPWITKSICDICKIHNISVTCVGSGGHYAFIDAVQPSGEKSFQHHYEISLALSVLGYELPSLKTCPITCVEAIHLKIIQIIRNSAEKLSTLPIEVELWAGGMERLVHPPLPENFALHLWSGCLGGFYNADRLCFPCKAGSFSPENSAECYLCEKGYYQDTPGASYCKPCRDGLNTSNKGSTSTNQCIGVVSLLVTNTSFLTSPWGIAIITVISLIIIIILIIIGIRCCCRGTSCGKVVDRFCCCCCSNNTTTGSTGSSTAKYSKLKTQDDIREDSQRQRTETKSSQRNESSSQKLKPPNDIRENYQKQRTEIKSFRRNESSSPNRRKSFESGKQAQKTHVAKSSRMQASNINIKTQQLEMKNNNDVQTNLDETDTECESDLDYKSEPHRCVKPNYKKLVIEKAAREVRARTVTATEDSSAPEQDDDMLLLEKKFKSPPKPPPVPEHLTYSKSKTKQVL